MSKHRCFFSPSLHDCDISCSVACSSIILQQQKRATLSFLDREIDDVLLRIISMNRVASPGKKAVAVKPKSVKSPPVKKGVTKKAKK
ncbi:hypothetical protein POTOM_018691 [Populus tomentosa]|uniref:Uncharacterized protein n=1 Tax=Populus tomentosa TaxID=118781 RepID=A0A8X8D478_POPTO|nr:hypothetical protein POTOM_018691 [Populus tomentosa]